MRDEELHQLAPLYALGALNPELTRTFIDHLPRCAECRIEIAEVRAAAIEPETQQVSPPEAMRSAVLSQIGDIPQVELPRAKRGRAAVRLTFAAAAALVVIVGGLIWFSQRDPSRSDTAEVAQEIRDAPDRIELQVGPTAGAPGQVSLTIDTVGGRTLVTATGLPEPGEGQEYQLWLIDGDQITPSELFRPAPGDDPSDDAEANTEEFVIEAVPTETVGVTLEPAGGSPSPTGEVLYAGSL